ncbi:MAG TPA: carboxylesterase family protein [Thermotogota bacterium]|nr:carboxylesterase family protein [Thermotogota bacterium]
MKKSKISEGKSVGKFLTMLLILAFITTAGISASNSIGVVSVEGGMIKGGPTDVDGVQVFKGIPFAGPTSGENRWSEPQPVVPWDGVRVCDTWGDQVMQNTNLNPTGAFWGDEFYFDPNFAPKASEEGLNLNVFTPAKTNGDKLPVLVYIHGGGNNHGYGSEMEFYASQLASKGIVVVNVQYRVSVFGFLTLKELSDESPEGVSGNYAVLDLIQALKWVNQNIEGFGGDPDSVTIAGQSAGAMNVTALLRTPLSKGLFERAIVQSGFSGFLTAEGATVYSSLEAKEAACEVAIEEAFGRKMTLEELRAIPAEEYLTRKTADGTKSLYDALTSASSGYVLDGYVFTEESVDLMRQGALDGYDIMIGGTSDEMTSLYGGPDNIMPLAQFAATMENSYGEGYKTVYRPSDERDAYRLFLRSSSDRCLQQFVLSSEYAKSHNDDLNIYVYYFNHTPPGRNAEFYGSFHSSELWYTFSSLRDVPGQRYWTSADYRMADIISSYFANFVRTGNPNGEGLTNWEQCNASTDGAFMRWHEGSAYNVSTTPYPERDALNRVAILKSIGLSEEDVEGAGNREGKAVLSGLGLIGYKSEIEPYDMQLNEAFSPERNAYTLTVNTTVEGFDLIPELSAEAKIMVNGKTLENGSAYYAKLSDTVPNSFEMIVTEPGKNDNVYTLSVSKKDLSTLYTSEKLTEGIWRISDYDAFPGYENMYLIEGTEKAVLIDTGMGKGNLMTFLKTLTNLPVEVALTHGHPDHVLQLDQFPGCKVYMSEKDFGMLKHFADTSNNEFVWVDDGDIIDLGGRKLEIISVGGHSSGCIMFLDRENKFLAIGDAIGSGSYVWMQIGTETIETYAKNLRKLEEELSAFDSLTFLSGHYWQERVPLTGKTGLQLVSDMRTVAEKVVSGEIEGKPLSDFVTAEYGLAGLWYNPERIHDDAD